MERPTHFPKHFFFFQIDAASLWYIHTVHGTSNVLKALTSKNDFTE